MFRRKEYEMKKVVLFCSIFALAYCSCSDGLNQNDPGNPPELDQYEWINITTSPPNPRVESAMVYDSENAKIILFGGRDHNWQMLNETWEYDIASNVWNQLITNGTPEGRLFHSMAYDPIGGQTILFGGYDGQQALDDLWVFNYITKTWQQLQSSNSPPARYLHAMTFDSEHNALIVFGGRFHNASQIYTLNDTWAYQFNNNTWVLLNSPVSPQAQDHSNMAYDPQEQKVVLFGGNGSNGSLGDTWVYDYSANQWSQMHPLHVPSPRDHLVMAYDSAGQGIILVGAGVGSDVDSWLYRFSENQWYKVNPSSKLPTGRDHMQGTSSGSQFFFYGGFSGGAGPHSDLWSLRTN